MEHRLSELIAAARPLIPVVLGSDKVRITGQMGIVPAMDVCFMKLKIEK